MPCRIRRLLSAGAAGENERSVILNATLFPYYTAFQSTDTTEQVFNWMLASEGKAIHTKLGIMAGGVANPKYLRFCPECFEYEIATLGEAYWHRIHQIPGVLVCPDHGCLLHNSNINCSGVRSNAFFPCNENTCCFDKNEFTLNNTEYSLTRDIANDVKWLIGNYFTIRCKYELEGNFRYLYLSLLREKGLTSDSFRLHIKPFMSSFRSYYGNNLLTIFESTVSIDNFNCWLLSIVRKQRKACHPLRHILIMKYLCGGIQNFIKISPSHNIDSKRVERSVNQVCAKDKRRYRSLWLNECSSNPDKFKTEIREKIPGIYTWLYRHDKAWLNAHSPNKPRKKNKERIDWVARDKFVLDEVKSVVRDLLFTVERPIRVTVTSIGKRTNRLAWIEKHLSKMPKTQDYFNKNLESQHEYRVRKIQWAIRQLELDNREVKAWIVLKMAGIRHEMWSHYKEYIINRDRDRDI